MAENDVYKKLKARSLISRREEALGGCASDILMLTQYAVNPMQAAQPFFLMAGPNVIQSQEHIFKMCREIKAVTDECDPDRPTLYSAAKRLGLSPGPHRTCRPPPPPRAQARD